MLEESFGDRVYRTRIGKTIRFAEAPVQGMSVIALRPRRPGGPLVPPARPRGGRSGARPGVGVGRPREAAA